MGKEILYTILIFIYIYMPPLFSVEILYILAPLSWALLILRYYKELKNIIFTKQVFLFILGLFISILLLSITNLFTTKQFYNANQILTIILNSLPCAIIITILLIKEKYDIYNFFRLLLNASLIQGIFAMIMFFYPDFKQLILKLFYSSYLDHYSLSYWSQYRINGLARNLMFATPIVQGFLAAIAIWLTVKKSIKFILYAPIILFSAVINARTGLVVFVICLFIILISNTRINKILPNIKIILLIIILLPISRILFYTIESTSPFIAEWIKGAIMETESLIKGEKLGYYEAASEMVFFPSIYEFFVGTGRHYFGSKYINLTTDIGYVNDLFLGGIFFAIILYSSFFYLFISTWRKNNQINFTLIILMIVTMLLANIKGFAFRQNEFVNLFIIISLVLINIKKNGILKVKS